MISDESDEMVDCGAVSAAVKNMKRRYGDEALAEVDLRIEELNSLQLADALELWMEVRKTLCLESESSIDKQDLEPGKGR